ncbi:hypothetical protein ASE74_20680 [Pedobacter sp. Leaf216]|uniref:NUDIX hydrolase n=1 Tax=Pedobacter sp. Leaf216 TaxID=1735684 RepID=UPI0006F72145|nr:hypothetical protein ASE74_20680 [Pedobacter sp. Leaf216]
MVSSYQLILCAHLFIRRYAYKQTDGYLFEACAGLIEPGDSPGQAVIREAGKKRGIKFLILFKSAQCIPLLVA